MSVQKDEVVSNGLDHSWRGFGIIDKVMELVRPIIDELNDPSHKLIHLKSVLEENKIASLSGLGKLRIGENGVNVVPTPGILLPDPNPKNLLGRQATVAGVTLAELPKSGSQLNLATRRTFITTHELKTKPLAKAVVPRDSVIPVSVAYWVASEIEIADHTHVVFRTKCKNLYIVAESIKIGNDVQFTWEQPRSPQSITKIPPPPQPRQRRRPDSEDHVIHGTEQINGQNGNNGVNGADAPAVEIWTLALTGRPVVAFAGQDGQDGQPGQDGSRGQNGAKGISAKIGTTPELFGFSIAHGCERHAGSGGDGARGGDGGDGGNGGNGGRGGRFSIFAPQGVLNDIGSKGFYSELDGGTGGRGGAGGLGGQGGQGGPIGRAAAGSGVGFDFECGPRKGARNGKEGRRGRSGESGRNGQPGGHDTDAIRLLAIDADAFQQKLTQPAIQRIVPEIVRVGQEISLEGRNFSNANLVVFNDQMVKPLSVQGTTRMSVKVPKLDGGRANVVVQQANDTTSNIYTIIIQPNVTAVSQEQASGNRLRPGHKVTIHGTGFSSDSLVFANEVALPEVEYVSNTELEAQLVRPFQANELPNPASEEATITVRLPTGTRSNDHLVVLDTFRMVVLGDSLQWGQGLQDHQKIHSLVEQEIKRRVGDIGVYKKALAHSGAIIGDDESPTVPPIPHEFGGEVNVSNPTIREQVVAALEGQDRDETVDLVLVDGGINDIGVTAILNPFNDDLGRDIEKYCYGRMKKLLRSIARRFPNAQIITTGYYRIVSSRSDSSFIPLIGAALGMLSGPGAIAGLTLGLLTQETLRDRSRQFRDGAHEQIRKAVADAMTEEPSAANRISFADPQFSDDEAIFAPNALLFGINGDLTPQDNDLIVTGRRLACEIHNPGEFTCPIASIGHPNPAGAQKIANAVIAQLQVGKLQDEMSGDGSEWFRGSLVRRVGYINTNSTRHKQVEYGVINDQEIFEGDIRLRPSSQMDEFDVSMLPQHGVAIVGEQFRWPGGVIPYEIDPAFPDPTLVQRAIDHWEQYTSLRFSRRTSTNEAQYPNYVRFVSKDGCWSYVGKQGGMQEISLNSGCGFGSTIHEIGHAAGLWHEQSRADRDRHIRILWQNIVSGMEYNFDQHITDGDDVGEYDTDSIMHYGPYAFSANGQPTIEAYDGSSIGQRNGLSAGDVAAIESMYGERPTAQPRPGVQLSTVLPARTTHRWVSGGWPASQNVNWQIVPTAQQTCQPPLLSWTLHAEREAPGLLRYCLEVENLCPSDVHFEWRYDLQSQNENGSGAYDAVSGDVPAADQPRPPADDAWATAIDAGGPPTWLSPKPQPTPGGDSNDYVDAGSSAVLPDPMNIPAQDQPNRESAVSYDEGETGAD